MRFRRLAVATCAMGTLTVNINNTALNLALPQIRDDLGLNLTAMQWVSATYVLVLAALTMLGGAMGDRFDKRTVLAVGLVIYTLGSVLGVVATDGVWLVLSRACAAVGAAVLVPVGLASLRVIAQTPKQLAGYMSLWGLAVGLGMALGPVVGGVVTGFFGWRVFLAAMAVLGVVFIGAVLAFLPCLPATAGRRINLVSHLFLGTGMFALTAFFIELPTNAPLALKIALGVAVPLCGALWLWSDRRSANPVVPPAAFADRAYSVSMMIAFVNYLALGATLFVSALLLQDLFGLPAQVAGIVSVPLALATAVGAAWSGRADGMDRVIGAIRLAAVAMFLGVVVAGVSAAAHGADVGVTASIALFVVGTSAMGFAFGAANTPVNYLAMASLPKSISGAAGSSASASRQLGQSTGVATGGLLLGIGVVHASVKSPEAYVLPGIEVALAAVLLFALPALYVRRSKPGIA